jgi:AraC family transcriptional regulator
MADSAVRTQDTSGTLRWQFQAGGFLVSESEFAPGIQTEPRAQTATSLVFGLRGTMERTHGHRSWVLRTRSLLVLPQGVIHADRVGRDGCVCLIVTPGASQLERIGLRSPVLESPRLTTDGRIGLIGMALRREALADDRFRALAVEAHIYEMLASLARQPGLPEECPAPWLAWLRNRLDAEFIAPPSLSALASEVGVGPACLARAFTRRYGESMAAFVRRRRLEWAAQALLQSDEPVARVALAAGFFDQSHFTRHFKRVVGMTPARFRTGAVSPLARHAG